MLQRYPLRGLTFYLIKRLAARIKPNKTAFFFESGIKVTENVTSEYDCRIYNWRCT